MLTNGQKRALHVAAREAGLTEEERRIVQRTVGGFHSAADRTATRVGFIRVMAHYEELCGGRLSGKTRGYWASQSDRADPLDAMRYAIREQANLLGWRPEQVDRFLASDHMSSGRYRRVRDAPAYWLHRLLSALKVLVAREEVATQ